MKKQLTDKNYILIQGFMVNDLKLKGNELLIYACIYGFCQKEGQSFNGGLAYLTEWTSTSKQCVMNCLKELENKGLIIKEEAYENNIKYCKYTTITGIQESCMVSKKVGYRIQESLPNNINNIYNNSSYINTLHSSKDKCNYINNKEFSEQQAVAENSLNNSNKSSVENLGKKDLIIGKNDSRYHLVQKQKELLSRPHAHASNPPIEDKPKKEIKRESYLRKAIEIVSQTLKIIEPEKLSIIRDWLFTLYDKGVVSTSIPRFKYTIEELEKYMKEFSWEILSKLIKEAITSNHSTLKYVVQSRGTNRYNKQRLSDMIKFPGMRQDETVDEYIGRSAEIEEERQKALKELHEAEENGTGTWY